MKTGCLLIYGYIDRWDVSATDFVDQLHELECEYDEIDVRINSFGGDVAEGLTMLNALRQSSAKIHIYIDGVAASMASAIALSGFPVTAAKCSLIMIHSPSTGVFGSKKDMENMSETLQKWEDVLADAYAGKGVFTSDEIKEKYFDGEDHWMSSSEALELGFVDDLYEDNSTPAATATTPYGIYAACAATQKKVISNNVKMDIKQFTSIPVFAQCKDESDVMTKVKELVTAAAQAESLRSENQALSQKVKDFEEAEAKAAKDAADSAIEAAIKDGRITADQKPAFVALFEKDAANAAAILGGIKAPIKVTDVIDNNIGDNSSQAITMDGRLEQIENNYKNK